MLDEIFKANVLAGLYATHERGSELLSMDLEEVIADAIRQHEAEKEEVIADAIRQHEDEKENSENSSNLDLKDHQ